MLHELPFRYFHQSEGILQQTKMREARSLSFVFDSIQCSVSGNITHQKKKKTFDLSAESILFLDHRWELTNLNGHFRFQDHYWALDSFSFPYPNEFLQHLPGVTTQKTHLKGLVFPFTNVGYSNYYHVLTELIPRLEFILPLKGKVRLALAEPSPAFVWDALKMLGFAQNDFLFLKSDVRYSADTWLMIPWGLNFIPERFSFVKNQLGLKTLPKRRIYITRKNENTRKIVNEDKLIPLLNAYGFEYVEAEKLSLNAQIKLFSEAEWIMSPHGAGLSNVLWMNQPKCIEIRPENYANECFTHLALSCGATQTTIIETPTVDSNQNMSLPIEQLKSMLTYLFD